MAADAHDRAGALSDPQDPDEGVSAVVGALSATLEALNENNRTLSAGTTWTIHTSHLWRTRWTVLVAADKTNHTK